MPVRRHGKGWEVRVQIAGRRASRTVRNRTDAFALERRWRDESIDSELGRTPRVALEEALTRWLTTEAAGLKSVRDLRNKVRALYPHIVGRRLDEIVDVAQAVKTAGIAAGLKPATLNRRLAILRRVANLAHREWGWLAEKLGDRIRLLPGERARHVYLSPADVRRLAAAAPAKVRPAILLAAMSGLRRAELLALTAANRREGALILADTKSGRPRVVPLPPDAAAIALPLGITDEQLRVGFERARKRTGLEHVHFHDLRHTYASWLVQAGVSLVAVRDLLGHSSLAVTDRYAHLATEHLRRAVGKLPAGLGRGRSRRKKAA